MRAAGHLDVDGEPGEGEERDEQGASVHIFLQERVVEAVQHHRHGHHAEQEEAEARAVLDGFVVLDVPLAIAIPTDADHMA